MNKTFDIHRFAMVLRWDILTNKKRYTGALLGLILGFTLIFIISLLSMRGWDYTESFHFSDPSEYFLNNNYSFFCIFMGIVPFVMATMIFHNMANKLSRENFLMLPASNLEKYFVRLLNMTLGSFILVILALIGADLVQLAFSFIITPSFHMSLSWPTLSRWITTEFSFGDFCAFLFFHSFCILGGAFYRKQPFLLTFVTGGVLLWALGCISIFFHPIFPRIPTEDICYIIICLCLTVFNYWASYKLFCRMQVICNKWINI